MGCNHMHCRCGQEFCWQCLSNWAPAAHYSCAKDSRMEVELFPFHKCTHYKFITLQTIALIDVTKGGLSLLSRKYYNLCLAHRKKHAEQGYITGVVQCMSKHVTREQ